MPSDPLDVVAAAWSLTAAELRSMLDARVGGASVLEAATVVGPAAPVLPAAGPPAPGPSPPGLPPPVLPPPALPAPRAPGPRSEGRYTHEGFLGRGAMGEVRRVYDHELARSVAMKVIRPSAQAQPELRGRFLAEAQVTAQLQHPGIVPVYDHGVLPDGRAWFTMKEVPGSTLGQAIKAAHADGPPDAPALRRLVQSYHQVCEAVAYAHGRGVVHRDLKPSNVMLGEHGEVLVLDWGIAKVSGAAAEEGGVVSEWSDTYATQVGAVTGTPAYMAPEVARGQSARVDARVDVYSLGAVLYQILSGVAPYSGSSLAVLQRVIAGPPESLAGAERPAEAHVLEQHRLPTALVSAVGRAMARDAGDRFADAMALADAVGAWLDGAARADRAREMLAEAESLEADARARRQAALGAAREADAGLAALPAWAPEADKAPWWDRADRAAEELRAATGMDLEVESRLRASLAHAPWLAAAHAALARRYRAEHAAAEAARIDAGRAEADLRRHALALPDDHPARAGHVAWLDGRGVLEFATDPPGAMARLYRFQPARRRLSPILVGEIGPTPIAGLAIAHGSYLLEVRHPRCETVRLPVHIRRGERWSATPPGAAAPRPLHLPKRSSLRPDERFVPAGWFQAGGDPVAVAALGPRTLWVDDWVVATTHVTNAQFLRFLDDLVARGRSAEALRHAPRERPGTPGEVGALIYGYTGGGFELRPDADGDVWEPDSPVLMVDFAGAEAYAAWRAARTGEPWQLLPELVWEKAARGVDGRVFPWGDDFDPTFACMRESHAGRALPAEVGSFPVDQSPYGIRDMAGNAATWCADPWQVEGPPDGARVEAPARPGADELRAVRGGTWNDAAEFLRAARRTFNAPGYRGSLLSVRIGRPLR